MKTLTFDRDQIIFAEGSFGISMYDIVSGRVGIFSKYGTTQQTKVAEMGPDDIFGEMGMIDVFPRSATVVALEDGVQVVEITEQDVSKYFGDKPEKMLKLLRALSARIRETNDKYMGVCKTVYECDEAEQAGTPYPPVANEELDMIRREYGQAKTMWLD